MRIWRRGPWLARLGGNDGGEARRLAELERAAGAVPEGCAWLDDRTVDDLDLAQVFGAIDRTRTATGAQVLWRWLAAPARSRDVLAARERESAAVAEPALRERLGDALGTTPAADAAMLPRLLWEPPAAPLPGALLWTLAAAMIALLVLARWWPPALLGAVAIFGVNLLLDDWSKLRLAQQARGLARARERHAQCQAARGRRARAAARDRAAGRQGRCGVLRRGAARGTRRHADRTGRRRRPRDRRARPRPSRAHARDRRRPRAPRRPARPRQLHVGQVDVPAHGRGQRDPRAGDPHDVRRVARDAAHCSHGDAARGRSCARDV